VRNIFFFIRRHFNLLLCLLLQGFAVYLIVHYSNYHEAVFGETANQVTGRINKSYSEFTGYFKLKKINDSLAKANAELYNKLAQNFEVPDSVPKTVIDSLNVDSLQQYRIYTYISARVVSNSVSQPNNFIILSKGSREGLHSGMGVVATGNKVAGIITGTSPDYAVVMSLLHKDSRISGKLLKSGETGTISWDGKEPNLITMANVPKSARIAVGDTVITSGFSTSFPAGLLIGRVQAVYAEKSSNNFLIRLRTFTDFNNLTYAYAINNVRQQAIEKVIDSLKKIR